MGSSEEYRPWISSRDWVCEEEGYTFLGEGLDGDKSEEDLVFLPGDSGIISSLAISYDSLSRLDQEVRGKLQIQMPVRFKKRCFH